MISIIIPIYKAEAHLRRCLDSIVRLNNQHWELLLIDDGSPDNSGKICDEYALRDPRIKVFHQSNGGVSSARNLGLDHAKGEWITFIDSDDSINEAYFDFDSSADIVLTNSCEVNSSGLVSDVSPLILDRLGDYKSFLADNLDHIRLRVPWGKIIRRSCIGSLRFPLNQRIGEDTAFMYQLLSQTSTISYNAKALYYWQVGDVSYSVKYCLSVDDDIKSFKTIIDGYEAIGVDCPSVERFLLTFFFKLVDKKKPGELHRWFEDQVIGSYLAKVYGRKLPLKLFFWKRMPVFLSYALPLFKRKKRK